MLDKVVILMLDNPSSKINDIPNKIGITADTIYYNIMKYLPQIFSRHYH